MSSSRLLPAVIAALALVAAAVAADEPAPLKFGWPVPARATVTENIQKSGHSVTTRYAASLALHGDGPDLLLHLSDFEVLDIDGRPGTDPALAAQTQMMLVSLKVTPDLVIGPAGDVKDVLGIDAAVEATLDELAKNADEKKKARLPELLAQFSSPEAKATMKENAKKAWTLWVGEWIGRTVPEGRGVDDTWPIACPDGTRIAAPTRIRRFAGESEGAGLVKFARESVLDGEDAKPILDAWLRQVVAATGRELPATGLRLVDRALTVADPATLRPKRVLHEEQRILTFDKLPERSDIERHEYTFAWPAK